ncbi:hypothetical protein F511_15167 [Dorcoceras hygrometricum]|uniref:Uncharacterized protein n=1 Tax=Dorcoceras hygrometricum TaxID=472368 RepID=A0A2Z7BG44_9LAMI|nr:hypothetical protein F511_15167 [Dorcoceras hygrometricum]
MRECAPSMAHIGRPATSPWRHVSSIHRTIVPSSVACSGRVERRMVRDGSREAAHGSALPALALHNDLRPSSPSGRATYNNGNSYDQIRENLALIPLLGIRIRPPARQRKNNKQKNREAALEALTRSARTNTPRKTRPEQIPAKLAAAAHGGGVFEVEEATAFA